jgi:hypothetical protein
MKTKTVKLELHSVVPPVIAATAHNQRGSLAGRIDLALTVLLVYGLIIGLSLPFFTAHDDRSENPTILLALVLIAGLLVSFIVSPIFVSTIRRVRRRVGFKRTCAIETREGSLRGQRQLIIGEETIAAGEIESITLLGWQEESGEDRVWDLTAICSQGKTVDIVSAYRDADEPRKLGEALASTMEVRFRESSVVGGQVTQHTPKSIIRRPEL